jgi:large subunit ribosomal protein L25
MKTLTLKATVKTTEKAKDIRMDKRVPGVVYGHQLASKSLSMNYKELRDVFQEAGFSSLVDLEVEGEKAPIKVIIHDIQHHPLSDNITHIDLFAINMKEPITTHIPIRFVGDSAAIKTFGAMLITQKTEVNIKCLPGDLVHHIDVDLAPLENFGDTLKISNITAPKGIQILHDPEDTIAQALEQKVAAEEEPMGPAVIPTPEEAAAAEAAAGEDKKEEKKEGK